MSIHVAKKESSSDIRQIRLHSQNDEDIEG